MRYVKTIFKIIVFAALAACNSEGSADSATGQGGSMTRFAIQEDRLYVVDHQAIKVFSIANDNFSQINEINVEFGLETIFARGEYLYLGANDAMYIYSISNRDEPKFVFRYAHIVSCDPVVVQGNRAYVTLRSGTRCNLASNVLDIIDITDPYSPSLLASYAMDSPHGLAIDGNTLFLCEGEYGLKVFNVAEEKNIKLVKEVKDLFAYDVIARQGVAIVTGEDGIVQFSYNELPQAFPVLSKIPVSREEL